MLPSFNSVTINKTSDLDNNTDTLKRLSVADKPNNQTKLASIGGTPLPPSQIKCNILKGSTKSDHNISLKYLFQYVYNVLIIFSTRRRESDYNTYKINQPIVR